MIVGYYVPKFANYPVPILGDTLHGWIAASIPALHCCCCFYHHCRRCCNYVTQTCSIRWHCRGHPKFNIIMHHVNSVSRHEQAIEHNIIYGSYEMLWLHTIDASRLIHKNQVRCSMVYPNAQMWPSPLIPSTHNRTYLAKCIVPSTLKLLGLGGRRATDHCFAVFSCLFVVWLIHSILIPPRGGQEELWPQ